MPLTMTALTFLKNCYDRLTQQFKLRKICNILASTALVAIIIAQLYNGAEVVFSRDDMWKRQIADFMRTYGKQNTPGRRVRIAALGLPEAVFWSGGESVFSYKSGVKDIRTFKDFDLLLIPKSSQKYVLRRKDLEQLPLPLECKYVLFKNQTPSGAGEAARCPAGQNRPAGSV